MRQTAVTILGIDPGYGRVGWCIGQAEGIDLKLVDYGCIETNSKSPLVVRFGEIQNFFQELVRQHSPTEAALESLFFTKNQTTGMQVSEARGVIKGVLLAVGIACYDYTPLQMKQAVTGFGKADKAAVERMIRLQFHLNDAKILDDTIDAIGITLTHTVSRNLRKQI